MPVEPGGRIGTPKNVTILGWLPSGLTMPWKTLAPAVVPPTVSVATVRPLTTVANSVQPDAGVGHSFCGACGPKPGTTEEAPEPGSSIISSASEAVGAAVVGNNRLVTLVFR